jgi:hypothetical protein
MPGREPYRHQIRGARPAGGAHGAHGARRRERYACRIYSHGELGAAMTKAGDGKLVLRRRRALRGHYALVAVREYTLRCSA